MADDVDTLRIPGVSRLRADLGRLRGLLSQAADVLWLNAALPIDPNETVSQERVEELLDAIAAELATPVP